MALSKAHAAVLLILVLFTPSLVGTHVQAQDDSTHGFGVNVVQAWDRGCSNDGWLSGDADLRVTVLMDGEKVFQTVKAQDQSAPYYAAFSWISHLRPPLNVSIKVHEAEPGGWFGMGTSWKECDTSPGPEMAYEANWTGEQREIHVKGNASNATEVKVGGRWWEIPNPAELFT